MGFYVVVRCRQCNSNMEKELSKQLYKSTLVVLKFLPMCMALSFMLNNICHDHVVNLISHVVGSNLLYFTFLYLTSHVFKFCNYHRIFIHYIVVIQTISVIDFYIGIPISNVAIRGLCSTISVVFLIISILMYIHKRLKSNSKNENNE